MAFNNTFTAVVGATYTASQYNTYVRDNFTAIWVGTTAGDIDYYTSSSAKARVAIGGAGAILKSTGSAPAWVTIGTAGQILMSTGSAPGWQSGERYIPVYLNSDVALATGNAQGWFMIPPALNGWNVTHVSAMRMSGTGVPTMTLRNVTDGVYVLSTQVTIDSGEVTSGTAATPPVINTSYDDVATYDILVVDVTAAGTSTLYCVFYVGFTKP